MIDSASKKWLRVLTDAPRSGPYIMLPVDQLEAVRRLFDANQVHYSVSELSVSLDGKPAVTTITLGRGANAKSIQSMLDSLN